MSRFTHSGVNTKMHNKFKLKCWQFAFVPKIFAIRSENILHYNKAATNF